VEEPQLKRSHVVAQGVLPSMRSEDATADQEADRPFDDRFAALFNDHYHRLFRYVDRLSGDADLAADVTQEAFVRLYRRGSMPDVPGAWLVSVAMNLFRSVRSAHSRRFRLLTPDRGKRAHSDPAPSPDARVQAIDQQQRVRFALDQVPERERRMLLLQAEGYSYHEIATMLDVNEASVGTLLARAKREFRQHYTEGDDAS